MRTVVTVALCLLISALPVFALGPADASLSLAIELDADGLHELAALEFRRCSLLLRAEDSEAKGGFLSAAAWEYQLADKPDLTLKMLDQAESSSQTARNFALLLRAETALSEGKFSESDFFLSTLDTSAAPPHFRTLAQSRLAITALRNEDAAAARKHLESLSSSESLEALDHMEAGNPKSPRLGGILGAIPGLGYAYSGEYANGLRSLILNGIFIYAMLETADDEQWGAFTALTFFELTWYTGSIYGGIDSAHRFNRRRTDAVIETIRSEYDYQLDLKAVPTIRLELSF